MPPANWPFRLDYMVHVSTTLSGTTLEFKIFSSPAFGYQSRPKYTFSRDMLSLCHFLARIHGVLGFDTLLIFSQYLAMVYQCTNMRLWFNWFSFFSPLGNHMRLFKSKNSIIIFILLPAICQDLSMLKMGAKLAISQLLFPSNIFNKLTLAHACWFSFCKSRDVRRYKKLSGSCVQ